mgnify:CR=1 FL=1
MLFRTPKLISALLDNLWLTARCSLRTARFGSMTWVPMLPLQISSNCSHSSGLILAFRVRELSPVPAV